MFRATRLERRAVRAAERGGEGGGGGEEMGGATRIHATASVRGVTGEDADRRGMEVRGAHVWIVRRKREGDRVGKAKVELQGIVLVRFREHD